MPRSHDARSLVGANTLSVGYQDDGQLPNITGWANIQNNKGSGGALYAGSATTVAAAYSSGNNNLLGFDASRCSNIYDSNATAVLPRRLQVLHCIKYI